MYNMKFPYNNHVMVWRRRQLRAQSSTPEVALWDRIKNNIEIDGKQHLKAQQYDLIRDRFLKAIDIHVLRFPSQRIFHDLDNVLKEIKSARYLK